MPANDPFNSREWGGDVRADIFFPALVFVHQFLLAEAIILPAHVGETQMIAAIGVFLQCDSRAWAEFIQYVFKKGKVHIPFTLHHCIIVIQHQAGVAQHDIISFPQIIAKKEELGNRNLIAFIEHMC